MLLLSLLLLEIILILGMGYFIVRKLTNHFKYHTQIKSFEPIIDKYTVERAVYNGVVSAIKQLDVEKEQYIIENSHKERSANEIYITKDSSDTPVKYSEGNLVPFNLTEAEKAILNMFYNKE